MPRKHARPEVQVERLAIQLRNRWTAADGIMPWLRKRLPLLTQLHQDEGWSWADVSRALNTAGITYETGRPWTGFLLARKINQARTQVRTRTAKRMDAVEASATRQSTRAVSSTTRERGRSAIPKLGKEALTFALASLAPTPFSPPAAPDDIGESNKPSSTRKRVDVDEIIRRLQGGDADSED